MAPTALETPESAPRATKLAKETSINGAAVQRPQIERYHAKDPSTTTDLLVSIIERDGGVIVENIISQELASQIRTDLKPYFDTDRVDPSGFFPDTTQRATGLLAKSDGCVELACNPTYINVANKMISSTYTYWAGQEQETVTSKPIISSTVGFRVNPGGRQQRLHRDDRFAVLRNFKGIISLTLVYNSDYHTSKADFPMMLGCVTALTKTTKDNGATIVIPGSHIWGLDRCPLDEEAVPAELNPGDALIFAGNTFHAGGGNITKYVCTVF